MYIAYVQAVYMEKFQRAPEMAYQQMITQYYCSLQISEDFEARGREETESS